METQINNPIVDWVLLKDQSPEEGRLVITWSNKTSSYRVCRGKKLPTYKWFKIIAYEYKLQNLLSKFAFDDDATHWVYFPNPPIE